LQPFTRRQLLDDGNLPRIPKTCILNLDTANNPYVHQHPAAPCAIFILLRVSRKRLRNLTKASPKLYEKGTDNEVTPAVPWSFGQGLDGKPEAGCLDLNPAHPDNLTLRLDYGPVCSRCAHHVEPIENLCNLLWTPAVAQRDPIAGPPGPQYGGLRSNRLCLSAETYTIFGRPNLTRQDKLVRRAGRSVRRTGTPGYTNLPWAALDRNVAGKLGLAGTGTLGRRQVRHCQKQFRLLEAEPRPQASSGSAQNPPGDCGVKRV